MMTMSYKTAAAAMTCAGAVGWSRESRADKARRGEAFARTRASEAHGNGCHAARRCIPGPSLRPAPSMARRDRVVLEHLAAGEGDRRARARESSRARRPGRSGSRRHPGPVRRRQQIQSRKAGGFFELRQASHQGRDSRQPAPARLGLARHAPPPQAGGSRHARSVLDLAARPHRSRSRRRSSAWTWIAGAP